MKTAIDVENKREGELIKQALADPETRAYVNIIGAFITLPTDRARQRTLTMVTDKLAEMAAGAKQ